MSSGCCEKPRATTPGAGEAAKNRKRRRASGDGDGDWDGNGSGNNIWNLGGDYSEGLFGVLVVWVMIFRHKEEGGKRSGNTQG